MAAETLQDNERILWSAEEIQRRVSELAGEISETMGGGDLACLVVLRGGFFFGADLVRQLKGFNSVEIDFVRLASYAGMDSTGDVQFRGSLPQVAGRKVLVIEDLLDTGLTLTTLADALCAAGAETVRYAVLVDKTYRRAHDLKPHYVAFKYDGGDYIYGYGMDVDNHRRELNYIGGMRHLE